MNDLTRRATQRDMRETPDNDTLLIQRALLKNRVPRRFRLGFGWAIVIGAALGVVADVVLQAAWL